MELKDMTIAQLEERKAAIMVELDAPDADLDALEDEARSIKEELEKRKAAETKRAEIRAAVAAGEGEVRSKIDSEGKKMKTFEEVRSSKEYINAYARYIRSEDDSECRALLTDNVESPLVGSVPVPTFVEGIIAEQLRESRIMSRVRKTYAKGNVKVGFEVSAPIATVHPEGSGAQEEEELSLGIVTLLPETLKKWVSISDESLDTMAGEAYLRYLYSELGRKIIAAEEKMVVDAILNAPANASETRPAVKKLTINNKSVGDFINARALLTSEASNLSIIITPSDYAEYKTLALSANFAFDPFEGIEVLFNDYAANPIIGDLSGVLANYPNGDEIQYKYDDRTLMTSDLVRVLGRKPVAIAVVGNNYFATITSGGD